MDFEKISSRSNEKVKLFRHLSQSASFRRETGLFALEGARLCSDVAKTGTGIVKFRFLCYSEKNGCCSVCLADCGNDFSDTL